MKFLYYILLNCESFLGVTFSFLSPKYFFIIKMILIKEIKGPLKNRHYRPNNWSISKVINSNLYLKLD